MRAWKVVKKLGKLLLEVFLSELNIGVIHKS